MLDGDSPEHSPTLNANIREICCKVQLHLLGHDEGIGRILAKLVGAGHSILHRLGRPDARSPTLNRLKWRRAVYIKQLPRRYNVTSTQVFLFLRPSRKSLPATSRVSFTRT